MSAVMHEATATDTAAALAHRVCCGTEHDPANGKLHGYCIVCGVEWPCETAQYFLRKPDAERRAIDTMLKSTNPVYLARLVADLVAQIELSQSESEGRYPQPDHGCIHCTAGTVPDIHNTGPCAYHRARKLLGRT